MHQQYKHGDCANTLTGGNRTVAILFFLLNFLKRKLAQT